MGDEVEEMHEEGTGGACPMWNLPDEILLSMLAFLPIEDLCSVIMVSTNLPPLEITNQKKNEKGTGYIYVSVV